MPAPPLSPRDLGISVPTVIHPPLPPFFPLPLFLAPSFNTSRAQVVRLRRPPLCVGGQSAERPPEEVGTSALLGTSLVRFQESKEINRFLLMEFLSSARTSKDSLSCASLPPRRVFHIQRSKDSCSAGETLKGKGARRGASMKAYLHQDSTKKHLGRRELHRLELLECEHPFAPLSGCVTCKFDPACCGAREGLGGEAGMPLVILACICLNRESATANPAILLFCLLTRLLRGVPGKYAVLQHKEAFLVCCAHHATFLVEPPALLLQLYSHMILLCRRQWQRQHSGQREEVPF